MLKYLKYRMRVICIKEFKHTYLDGKPNKIFESDAEKRVCGAGY